MSDYYVLAEDGKTPIAADGQQFDSRTRRDGFDWRRVAYDTLPGDVAVSTVFLGLNHRYGDGPPLLWETMIFGGPHDGYQERYSSYDDAVRGHAEAVAIATSPKDETPNPPQSLLPQLDERSSK